MKTSDTDRQRSERGAVLIMVAMAMLAMLAFGAFFVDYGVMWASRGQIQTAADAGALAGAVALAYDDAADFNGAKAKAQAVARAVGGADRHEIPAAGVAGQEDTIWFLDRASASAL